MWPLSVSTEAAGVKGLGHEHLSGGHEGGDVTVQNMRFCSGGLRKEEKKGAARFQSPSSQALAGVIDVQRLKLLHSLKLFDELFSPEHCFIKLVNKVLLSYWNRQYQPGLCCVFADGEI